MQRSKSLDSMKLKRPPKRKKVDSPPSSSSSHCTLGVPSSDDGDAPMRKSMVPETQTSNVDLWIQQAKNHAMAEAQQDGCTGNFRMFDSPFGNYLVPVIPTHAELDGSDSANLVDLVPVIPTHAEVVELDSADLVLVRSPEPSLFNPFLNSIE